ncbi:hypothetical protein C8J57DRAFT_1257401 [Mycena rebaudengoi]|nr:hypothetical protein C8J57DRAFT_1257401 [Mycena rebaudengoi]
MTTSDVALREQRVAPAADREAAFEWIGASNGRQLTGVAASVGVRGANKEGFQGREYFGAIRKRARVVLTYVNKAQWGLPKTADSEEMIHHDRPMIRGPVIDHIPTYACTNGIVPPGDASGVDERLETVSPVLHSQPDSDAESESFRIRPQTRHHSEETTVGMLVGGADVIWDWDAYHTHAHVYPTSGSDATSEPEVRPVCVCVCVCGAGKGLIDTGTSAPKLTHTQAHPLRAHARQTRRQL